MEYKIVYTKKFEKDIKNLKKQNKDLTELFDVSGEKKSKLTVEDLLKKFSETKDAPSDAMILG